MGDEDESISGWDQYDEWAEGACGDDYDDGDYLCQLFSMAAESEKCLDHAWESFMMYGFFFSVHPNQQKLTGMKLTEDEVRMVANQNYVDWERFHTEIITKIFEYRATNAHNAVVRSIKYDNWKFSYIETLSTKYPDELNDADEIKREQWRAIVYSFGIEFAKVLEGTITIGGEDLWSDINQVLCTHRDWMPEDINSRQKIYYIAGFLIKAVEKNAKRNISEEASTLFMSKASVDRSVASRDGLPIEDVQTREVDRLFFASKEFYNVTLKLECVFYHILRNDSIAKFGPQIIADIETHLNKVDIGIESLLSDGSSDVDEEDMCNLKGRIIEAFCNMRGKDFVRKRRALAGANYTESHRAEIGTIAKQAKERASKKEKKKGRGEDSSVSIDNDINVDVMLCPQLKAELKKRGLHVTGLKAELQDRLRDDIANRKRRAQEQSS